jgi:hypothetical protein
MKLDKEQQKVLKAFWPISLVYIIGLPFFMWLFGKMDSWGDALLLALGGFLLSIIMGAFYILGSKIPKKDK